MSSNTSISFSSSGFSTSSSSFSTSTSDTHSSGTRSASYTQTNPDGSKTIQTVTQNLGEPAVTEERRFDPTGRELLSEGGKDAGQGQGRIEDVTDREERGKEERDAEYLERMEDEYAKREGGA